MDRVEKAKTYGTLAMMHAKQKGLGGKNQPPLPTIKPETPAWDAWQRYFVDHLEFMPLQMKRVLSGQSQEMTVPAAWPDEFDGSYSAHRTAAE